MEHQARRNEGIVWWRRVWVRAAIARGRAAGGAPMCPSTHCGPITITTVGVRWVGGGRAPATAAERERGRQGSTCQTTTANIQTVAVRSGLGLCLHNKLSRLALLNHRKQFTRTPWQMPLRKEDRRGKLSAPSERLQSVWEDASKILDLTPGELGSLGKDLCWYFRCRALHPTDLFWIQFYTAGEIPGSWKPLLFLLLFGWLEKEKKKANKNNKPNKGGGCLPGAYFSINVKTENCFFHSYLPQYCTSIVSVLQSCLIN